MNVLTAKFIEYGFSLIAAPLAMLFIQFLKGWSYSVDKLKPWPKRFLVALTVAVFLAIGAVTGVDFGIPADAENLDFIANLDTGVIKTAIGAGLAHLLWMLKKAVFKN